MNPESQWHEHHAYLRAQRLVVLTPVFEDTEASAILYGELRRELGDDICVVAVDDGSVSHTVEVDQLAAAGVDGLVIKLKRNVGHQRAIAIGLAYLAPHLADDVRVVVMDSDGEDMPQSVSSLLQGLEAGDVDLVVAARRSRVESAAFKLFYALYKIIFWLLTGRVIRFGNFMALTQFAVKRLVVMQETSIHIAGAVLASRLRTRTLSLDRGARYAGQSKMNFVSLVLHGFKALMVFAEDVLVRVGIACVLVAGLAVLGAVVAIILKIIGFSTPGWFSVALGILVLIFMQTGALALMTLMLTGVVRGGTVANMLTYQDFVVSVERAAGAGEGSLPETAAC